MPKRKVIFLDRDGTINVDYKNVSRWENWEWLPGAIEALQMFQQGGFSLAVVTNQSGIGHGLYTLEDMQQIHRQMERILADEGVRLDMIAYCPHRRDEGCACRKPAVGMAHQVERVIGPIDYGSSWLIGDKVADVVFGKNVGAHTALIKSGYWQADELLVKPDMVVDSLSEAAAKIEAAISVR